MLVLLVDAMGWELARRTPGFLGDLPHRCRLETILGFSSGALPTLFTGRMPDEHGRWLMYRRARGGSPFAGFGALRLLPDRVRRGPVLARVLTTLVGSRGVHGYFHLYDVPREQLGRFDLAERCDIFAPGGLPGDSLWDSVARSGLRWRSWNWRTPESENLTALESILKRGDERFLFCYTADLDALLHREGTNGPAVRARLARYDALVARALERAQAKDESLWVYVLSDHGMVDVTRTVDVMGRVAALPYRAPRDFLAFYDSTFARFWWKSEPARHAIEESLAELAGGRWLDAGALERAGCAFPDAAYGESIWLCDPGVLMVPSFMGRAPLAGMHGYDPSHPDMAALLWSNRPVPEGVTHLRDVRAFLESELEALAAGTA